LTVAKRASHYVCQSCGTVAPKWSGRCEACGEWNSIVEEARQTNVPGGLSRGGGARARPPDFHALEGPADRSPRRTTGIAELDRVCGSGLVAGSAVLIGGDPGIGKSTLVLQAAVGLAGNRAGDAGGIGTCAYISGEESIEQVRLRARRLGLSAPGVRLASATSVRDIAASLDGQTTPTAVIIDSIQTMFVDSLDSAPGTVAQVRASAQELIRLAKTQGFTLFLVGHVTKEGILAGPRVLEHMVDTVLYFEGERGHQFRILRAVKNRFGPTDEIGVFEMVGPVPGRAPRQRLGRGGFCGNRRHAAPAGRDPGLGIALPPRDAAPRCGRLGQRTPGDGAGRAGGPLWPGIGRQGRVSERCGGLANQRTGRRPGGGGRARLGRQWSTGA
jgi:DNA repair protein RadA/Sms